MDYLELCQRASWEGGLPGSGPDTVVGQTGQAMRVVAWVQQAWTDIQIMKAGRWRWMRHTFTFDTTADEDTYAYGAVTDTTVSPNAVITRFNRWRIQDRVHPARIYKTAAGVGNQSRLTYIGFEAFAETYKFGNVNASTPTVITVNPQDKLVLAPTPNDVYTVTGEYYIGPQTLTANGDIPECPEQFHMAIVFQALIKYGYRSVATDVLARCRQELPGYMGPLMLQQSEALRGFRAAGPMA